MPSSERATTAASLELPGYLLEKYRRAHEYRETSFKSHEYNMDALVKRSLGFSVELRVCAEMLEGWVAALGVPVTYDLISRLNQVIEGIDALQPAWRGVVTSRKEELRLQDDLYEASCGSYATMRDKSEQLEKELKTLMHDRDRKDASLDHAIDYVHAVIAERSAWQEKFGYNRQELPMEETSFSEGCMAALSALYTARRGHSDEKKGEKSEPNMHQQIPIAKPNTSISTSAPDLVRRWKRIEDSRFSAVSKASRLKYIPPAEEVSLLREVLSMGTGSTTLMKDIWNERERLKELKEGIFREANELTELLNGIKRDLRVLRWFLREHSERRSPFLCQEAELVQMLSEHIESQSSALARQYMRDYELEQRKEGYSTSSGRSPFAESDALQMHESKMEELERQGFRRTSWFKDVDTALSTEMSQNSSDRLTIATQSSFKGLTSEPGKKLNAPIILPIAPEDDEN